MKTFTAIVEKCPQTGLFVGHIPGFVGAHSQGETLDELGCNLQEVVEMLLEDGEPQMESEFVGMQLVAVACVTGETSGSQAARSDSHLASPRFSRSQTTRFAQAVSTH